MTGVVPSGEIHPIAARFPLLADDELGELAADIRANGLRQPITLDDAGVLLDGGDRLRTCELAGVAPTFATYRGDAISFIVSANVRRRHLSKGQAAMALAKAQRFPRKISTQRKARQGRGCQWGARLEGHRRHGVCPSIWWTRCWLARSR